MFIEGKPLNRPLHAQNSGVNGGKADICQMFFLHENNRKIYCKHKPVASDHNKWEDLCYSCWLPRNEKLVEINIIKNLLSLSLSLLAALFLLDPFLFLFLIL